MNPSPADDYAILMAEGREQLQVSAVPNPGAAHKAFMAANQLASNTSEHVQALQMAGIASRKAGDIFRAIDELSYALELAEKDGTFCLLIATVLRDLGAAYQTLYNRRRRIEDVEDRDKVASSTDDLQGLMDKAYKRAHACMDRSRRILLALASQSNIEVPELQDEYRLEYEVTLGFQSHLEFQRARDLETMDTRRRQREFARFKIRNTARILRELDNRVYELNHLKRALRTSRWFSRLPFLARALYLVLRRGSESRGDLKVVLASALGDQVALHFELAQYPDELVIGKSLPEWSLR